jgi:hypothetical protein
MTDPCNELGRLVALYLEQHAAWMRTAGPGEDLDADRHEFAALEDTAVRIIRLPCRDIDEARQKIDAVLDLPGLYTMVREDPLGYPDLLRVFLTSLFPAD